MTEKEFEKGIKVGQIWEVITDSFLTSWEWEEKRTGKRQTKIKKWEKIEIRFPYAWHFRCEDNMYFHAEESEILKNCKLFGKVWGDVKFENKWTLGDILRFGLYDKK